MKKLIIVAAIAASALVSQAASFDWVTGSKAYSIAADTITAGLSAGHYGVGSNNASSMSNQISSFGATWAYEITLTSGSNSDVINGTLTSGDFSSRAIYATGLSSTIWDSATSESPITVDYSIVITGTLKDGKNVEWTLTSDAIVGQVDFAGIGDIAFSTATPSGWTAASVPEPTSGLLMLLGMAGLALKRKRA